MALKKTEDRVMFDRAIAHLKMNPNEHYYKATKAVTQEFMLSPNIVVANATYEPQQKHLGCGVYQLSYKKAGPQAIKV